MPVGNLCARASQWVVQRCACGTDSDAELALEPAIEATLPTPLPRRGCALCPAMPIPPPYRAPLRTGFLHLVPVVLVADMIPRCRSLDYPPLSNRDVVLSFGGLSLVAEVVIRLTPVRHEPLARVCLTRW
jgi:hypothetical protein